MLIPFLDALDQRVLVCDGAMGTMLYAKGIFINKIFDELNLTQPDLVAEVHQAYVRAGADVIETNTFGANRIKLGAVRPGRSRARDQRAGGARSRGTRRASRPTSPARSGRSASASSRGARPASTRRAEYFREQAQALVEGGVDLFILETFRDLNEIGAAIGAVRSVSDLPIVAQMTTEEDGNTPRRRAAGALRRRSSSGAAPTSSASTAASDRRAMLETIERMARGRARRSCRRSPTPASRATSRGATCTCARPSTWRRTRGASSARRAPRRRLLRHDAGAHPPDQGGGARRWRRRPRAPATAARRAGVAARRARRRRRRCRASRSRGMAQRAGARRVRRRRRARAAARLRRRRARSSRRAQLKIHGVDVVNIPDGPRAGARMSALSLAVLVEQQAGIETILHYACRDRNLLGMQSDLLGAHAMGLRNLLLITGDPPASRRLSGCDGGVRRRLDRADQRRRAAQPRAATSAGRRSARPTAFHIGVAVNPAALEPRRGAAAVRLQGRGGRRVRRHAAGLRRRRLRGVPESGSSARGLPIIAGILPFESLRNAEFMANEVPGVRCPRR